MEVAERSHVRCFTLSKEGRVAHRVIVIPTVIIRKILVVSRSVPSFIHLVLASSMLQDLRREVMFELERKLQLAIAQQDDRSFWIFLDF